MLKKSEKILINELIKEESQTIFRLLGITFNNIGCYYKRDSKPKVALKYLKKSLEIEIYSSNDKISIAGTHLNICAILSFLGKHKQAIKHAKVSIDLLEISRTSLQEMIDKKKGIEDEEIDQAKEEKH